MRPTLALGLIALASISGCGLRGDLERPAPLWGNPDLERASSLDENENPSVFENPFSTPLIPEDEDKAFETPAPTPAAKRPDTPDTAPQDDKPG